MIEYTRESFIEMASKLDKDREARGESPLTRDQFIQLTGVSRKDMYKLFPDGHWGKLSELAQIRIHPCGRRNFTNDELIAQFHEVTKQTGRLPTRHEFSTRSDDFTYSSIVNRFGGMPR